LVEVEVKEVYNSGILLVIYVEESRRHFWKF